MHACCSTSQRATDSALRQPSVAVAGLWFAAKVVLWAAGSGWHKAGPDQQLPPHVAWNQVTDAERQSLDGSAHAENISRGQQRGPARTHSYKLPESKPVLNNAHNLLCMTMQESTVALQIPCTITNSHADCLQYSSVQPLVVLGTA